MARPHNWATDGTPLDLIGQPFTPGRGTFDGVTIVVSGDIPMAQDKAPADGTYVLDGVPYLTRKDALLPEGAKFTAGPLPGDEDYDTKVAKRSKGEAPENRAKAEKPEGR